MKNLLSLAFAAFVFACVFACTQPEGKKQSGAAVGIKPDTVIPFMDPEKARFAISTWDALRSRIVSNLDTTHFMDTAYVAKGFHVPLNDLRRILANIGDTTQLYAMLAVQDSAGNPAKPQLTLIFQAPDQDRVLRYYDFTLPCPKQCPSNQ